MIFLVKTICKIIAIPIILVLTILNAFFKFLIHLSGLLLGIVAFIFGLGGIILLFNKDVYGGIGVLVIAFLISPFGLPAAAGWISGLIDALNTSLKNFITS